jgi:type II secretory pathway pseudopilin PulG
MKSRDEPRRLPVAWLEESWAMSLGRSAGGNFDHFHAGAGRMEAVWLKRAPGLATRKRGCPRSSAFTILEMLIVVGIIGFLAALALPHLTGMTQANSMTAAAQQMSAAVSLARQMAVSRRSTVYLVFDSPSAFAPPYSTPVNNLNTWSNLQTHEYTAYTLVSPRSVGDQPGRPNPQYLTEWKTLPAGVFIPTYMFNNAGPLITVSATNTLAPPSSQVHTFYFVPFPQVALPFPAANAATVPMACIGFSPLGQLITPSAGYPDVFIPLARGAVQYLPNASGTYSAVATESPTGNSISDCNLIHIDYLTARPKLERNQF